MTWIITNSGTAFDYLAAQAAMVKPTDLAHALSHVCRFNGHCAWHYSVAQHSLLVADIVQQEGGTQDEILAGLLHDATEAYVNDLTRPLKLLLVEAARQRNEVWRTVLAEQGADPAGGHLKAAIRHLFPNEQGQGLSALVDVYQQIEERVWLAVCERFDLAPDLPDCVKNADLVALATEKRDLLPAHPAEWDCLEGYAPLPHRITQWRPEQARQHYFQRLMELLATTHRTRSRAA